MIDESINYASVISEHSDKIFMALVSSSRPENAIFNLYEIADNKDAFVAGLIGSLILRHKQWQALASEAAINSKEVRPK